MRWAQIWVRIGDPAPVDAGELTFLATYPRTPYLARFDRGDGKKVVQRNWWAVPTLRN
ncbi:MAG: hypothetical protein IH986_07345 [Planctomycetes bacterium]|nr:hypothetical protein [Planctomycetota bacterium]